MEAVSDLLQPILALQSTILPWHWFIIAVALGALEMLFTGGVLMGGAIAAILVGAASFAAQRFPDALPPDLGFGLGTQAATFLVLTLVFATAMRIGRRRAAAMVARAAGAPVQPATAAPAVASSAPAVAPVPPPEAPKPLAPAVAAPIQPALSSAPARTEPAKPEKPSLPPAPATPVAPPTPAAAPARTARPAPPPPRPTQMGPMRVSGPTAVTTPPAAAKPAAPAATAPATKAPGAPTAAPPKAAPKPEELVGREYTLWKPLAGGTGTLRIGGADWALSGPDLAAGSRVRVTGVQGTTLVVVSAS